MNERKPGINLSSAAFVILIVVFIAIIPISMTVSLWTGTQLISHNLVTLATFMRTRIQNEGADFLYRHGRLQTLWTHDGRVDGEHVIAGDLSLFVKGVTQGYRVTVTQEAPNRYAIEAIYTGRWLLYRAVSPAFERISDDIRGISYRTTVTVMQ